MKTDYKHGRFTILTNEIDYDEWREEYEQFCEDSCTIKTESNFRDWVEEENRENYLFDLHNIKDYAGYDVPVVLHGTLGLWWGRPEIKPMRFDSVYDAIKKCIGRDTELVTVEYNDGRIEIKCTHHNGTNCFMIRALSKKGQAKKSDSYVDADYKRLEYLYA